MASGRAQPPWATDDQWAHVRQATGGGRAADRACISGDSQAGAQSRASSGMSITSLSFKQKLKPTLEANPYEGALGPTIGEGTVTASSFSRLDVRKVIKTPSEVWKQGKAPTIPHSKNPGHHGELRAQQRKFPTALAALRGRRVSAADESADQSEDGGSGFGSELPSGVYGAWAQTPDIHTVSSHRSHSEFDKGKKEHPRSRSAAAMLEGPGQGGFISESQGTIADAKTSLAAAQNPLSEIEQQEVEVLNLKAHLSRLERIRSDDRGAEKEGEMARLQEKHQSNDKDVAEAAEADKDLDDFRERIEARIAATDQRIPELAQQRVALEEVVRRLKLVNKGLTWRLNQGKEEQRVYVSELKDVAALSSDVVASRDSSLQSLAELKASVVEERQRRERELARRQGTVERMLRETKQQAERLKEEKAARDQAAAEREAEAELAMLLAEQNGTAMGAELQKLRARRNEEKEKEAEKEKGPVIAAMKKILQVCKTEEAEEAATFLVKSRDRHETLQGLKDALQSRALALRSELASNQAERERLDKQGGEGEEEVLEQEEEEERASLERMVGDIETFADQNRQVDEAMRGLTEGFLAWAVRVLAQMVAYTADDKFLKQALHFAKQLRDAPEESELLAACEEEAMELVLQSCLHMISVVSRTRTLPKQPEAPDNKVPDPPSRDTGEHIKAISGKQTLMVSRGKASSTMQPLDPHPGF